MRIRAAVTTATLAATMILGGAATALAHGTDDDHPSGSAHHSACELSAAVIHGNPIFHEGCAGGDIIWH
ncbi:hypothetical protein ACGFYQ_35320 [Streptomyces sp. NPDC048258]|uniref:hypothetical protein n=1 Tax=Streptomyces sp. NPDC048258 TaxID=3365527 RepID=UPI00371D194C